MARKLGLGLGVICTCVVLAGCQSGAGSRLTGNAQNRPPAGAFAKQGTPPAPNFPTNTQNPGFSTSTNGVFPTAPNNNPNNGGFAPQNAAPINANNNPPSLTPQSPQGFGTPTTSNRNVQLTTPGTPNFPPPPAQPGISQIPQIP